MPSYVKNRTLINSYAQNFCPIDLVDVRSLKGGVAIQADINADHASESDSDDTTLSDPPLDECTPPLTHASRGRPSKKRKHNGENERRRKREKIRDRMLSSVLQSVVTLVKAWVIMLEPALSLICRSTDEWAA
jgi:hypothetical protein